MANIVRAKDMKISVIIPVYNAEKYLEKSIQSVLNQTYKDWEIIAIDDESEDSSYQILQMFAQKDSRIKINTKKNEGPGLTRNRALDQATGEFVVFLDADDYIEPDYFELLNQTVKNENADVVFIDVIQENIEGNVIKHEKMSKFKDCCRKKMLGCQMTGYMPWGGCRKAASRSLIESEKIRYSADTVGEEAIYSFELLRNAKKICFIEKELYHYVNHPGSQSKNPDGTWEITLEKMKKHLQEKKLLDEYKECLNAFAFTVSILCLLKDAKSFSSWECRKYFKEKVKKNQDLYGKKITTSYLRKEVRILWGIVRMNIVFPVVVAAKMVKR